MLEAMLERLEVAPAEVQPKDVLVARITRGGQRTLWPPGRVVLAVRATSIGVNLTITHPDVDCGRQIVGVAPDETVEVDRPRGGDGR